MSRAGVVPPVVRGECLRRRTGRGPAAWKHRGTRDVQCQGAGREQGRGRRVGADPGSRRALHAGLQSHDRPRRRSESVDILDSSPRSGKLRMWAMWSWPAGNRRFGGQGRLHPIRAARLSSSRRRPVAFLGGQAEAKPRAGYEVAVIQLKVDVRAARAPERWRLLRGSGPAARPACKSMTMPRRRLHSRRSHASNRGCPARSRTPDCGPVQPLVTMKHPLLAIVLVCVVSFSLRTGAARLADHHGRSCVRAQPHR